MRSRPARRSATGPCARTRGRDPASRHQAVERPAGRGRPGLRRASTSAFAQMADAETLTEAGDVPGTLAYISPERLAGGGATPAADVWAVGVMLWEALAGRHPFWRGSMLETARAIEAGARPLGELRPDLPKPLLRVVDGSLSTVSWRGGRRPATRRTPCVAWPTRPFRGRDSSCRRGSSRDRRAPPSLGRSSPAGPRPRCRSIRPARRCYSRSSPSRRRSCASA